MKYQDESFEDVNRKVSSIVNKFKNSIKGFEEDMYQELMLHAIDKSSDYYDLYRKAIDIYRSLSVKYRRENVQEEIEIENTQNDYLKVDQSYDLYKALLAINKELERPGYNKSDNEKLKICKSILIEILEDEDTGDSNIPKYIKGRLNLTLTSERLNVSYKRVQSSIKILQDIILGLMILGKISIDKEYITNFF